MKRLAEGGQALAELYQRYGASAYSLARAIVRNDADAEEVVLDAFLKVWRDAGSFDPARGSVRAWIATIARTRALDRVRSLRRQQGALERSAREDAVGLAAPLSIPADTEIQLERSVARARLEGWLIELPAEQREALELAYFEGYTQSEIAQHLETPLGTVKTRIRTALTSLRARVVPARSGGG